MAVVTIRGGSAPLQPRGRPDPGKGNRDASSGSEGKIEAIAVKVCSLRCGALRNPAPYARNGLYAGCLAGLGGPLLGAPRSNTVGRGRTKNAFGGRLFPQDVGAGCTVAARCGEPRGGGLRRRGSLPRSHAGGWR